MLTPSDIEMVILSKWVKVQTANKTGYYEYTSIFSTVFKHINGN